MQNYIYEDDIERQCCELCMEHHHYDHHYAGDPNIPTPQAWPGRQSMTEVLAVDTLRRKIRQLNHDATDIVDGLSDDELDQAVACLTNYERLADPRQINHNMMGYLREGISVQVAQRDGHKEERTIRLLDFSHPDCNEFWVVNQMWIEGPRYWLRPDVLLYINGIPLVTIELKDADVNVKQAYDDNLTRYKAELPGLMAYNAFLVASNGIDTRVGATYASWDFFCPWLKVDEGDRVDRQEIKNLRCSLDYVIFGLFGKERLMDYVENFIMSFNGLTKICAENHQFLGVNRAYQRLCDILDGRVAEEKRDKLGVFWHTQGSGKTFSMIFLARKIEQRLKGDFTFLIVTDREDLDDQAYKNFLRAGFMTETEQCRPQSGEKLREMLATNKRILFTLIQKFRYVKGRTYPVLSRRSDIIVFVDEAHRTQYKDLAENMRKGLPNARYMAFTGTPLFGSRELTQRWFGEIVSEYNFDDAIADGTTLGLTYRNHQPKVENNNPTFSEDFARILEVDNVSDDNEQRLQREFAQQIEVLKRPARLDAVARDIAHHFWLRSYLGKGMVVCVDKFTAVRMHDLVKHYWEEEIKRVNQQLSTMDKQSDAFRHLHDVRRWMEETKMAVVVSQEDGEDEKFASEGLDIRPHRQLMDTVDKEGHGLDDRFKDDGDPLRLVFVCAMWLTGFDVPTLSTLYIDKPLTGHTLMQAIARANRRSDFAILGQRKTVGELVAYSDIWSQLLRALKEYGNHKDEQGDSDDNQNEDHEPRDVEHIYQLLQATIDQCLTWLNQELDIDLSSILGKGEVFKKIDAFAIYANRIMGEQAQKQQFFVFANLIEDLYNEARPDILATGKRFEMAKVIVYLRRVIANNVDERDIDAARHKIKRLLDRSVVPENMAAEPAYVIDKKPAISLKDLNLDDIKFAYRAAELKNVELNDLVDFIQQKLEQMQKTNVNRKSFADRFQRIIEEYNAGSYKSDQYLDELLQFVRSLSKEEERAQREDLTEEQLELFDILKKDKMTKEETLKVKTAARELLDAMRKEQRRLFPIDWYKDTQLKAKFKNFIGSHLNDTLPASYDRKIFAEKKELVFSVYLNKASQHCWMFSA